MARSALGRRRGTRRGDGGKTTVLIALVFCLLVVALMLGILLGTHVLSSNSSGNSRVGVHQLIRGGAVGINGQALNDLEDAIRKRSEQHQDDDQHLQQVRPAGHINEGDDDHIDAAADAASGKSDRDMTKELHPHGNAQVGEEPTEIYPYSLHKVPSDFDFTAWTAPGADRFAEYKTGGTPWMITDEIIEKSDECARSRRYHVKNAMKFAWEGYTKHAFGMDEVLPQSGGPSSRWGGMGTTLVDSLDTLWLMGMKEEFWKARDWVRDKLDCSHVGHVSVFETTIRSLGGLLAAFDWSGDRAFLDKANDLGERLFKAFDNPTGLPYGQVSLSTGGTNNLGWTGGNGIVAEMGTLQIEFRYLAKAMDRKEFATTSEKVFEILDKMPHIHGLYPYYIRNRQNPPSFANNKLTFGAMADSLYEYMLKIWIQGGKTEPFYRNMYDRAMDGMHEMLLQTSTPSGLTYIADKSGAAMDHKMDHLVCFMGGLLALGAYTDPQGLESERAQRDLRTAKALTYTCYQMYARMNTGISPEFIQFSTGSDFHVGHGSPHYLLRPEAVESFYILNFLTGDPVYREWGWEVFCAIERYCKTSIAYGSLKDVQDTHRPPENSMESFFLAETLKYLYLLQDPDSEVDVLEKHVFNTEAHPMRIFPIIDADKKKSSSSF